MKEGMRQCTETIPVSVPHSAATTTPSGAAAYSGQPQRTMAMDSMEAASAITEPTERSMPPMMRMKVMPTDITTSGGMSLESVMKVAALRKFSLRKANITHMASKAAIRPR
jgi:hypothetical protein